MPMTSQNSNSNISLKQEMNTNRMFFERGNTESSHNQSLPMHQMNLNQSSNSQLPYANGRAPSMDKENFPVMNPNIVMKP
jgi:hypothetical protein